MIQPFYLQARIKAAISQSTAGTPTDKPIPHAGLSIPVAPIHANSKPIGTLPHARARQNLPKGMRTSPAM
ncbi:MAG: hypothetical protein ABJZ54_04190, partial [Luteolibacter sp.]